MRKVIFMLLFSFLLMLLSGCDGLSTVQNDSSSAVLTSSLKETESEDNNKVENVENYNFYQITSDNDVFSKAINNNPIDKAYELEMYKNATTTTEFLQVESKYLNIWIEEMNKAILDFTANLSATDKEEFLKLQSDWETTSIKNLELEKNIVNNSNYVQKQPNSFNYLWVSEKRELYKERTIRIKYMLYLIEERKFANNQTVDYLSLKFQGKTVDDFLS